jgi:hypothetical protein
MGLGTASGGGLRGAKILDKNKERVYSSNMGNEIFKLIKENKVWMGFNNGAKKFIVPRECQHLTTTMSKDGVRLTSM